MAKSEKSLTFDLSLLVTSGPTGTHVTSVSVLDLSEREAKKIVAWFSGNPPQDSFLVTEDGCLAVRASSIIGVRIAPYDAVKAATNQSTTNPFAPPVYGPGGYTTGSNN